MVYLQKKYFLSHGVVNGRLSLSPYYVMLFYMLMKFKGTVEIMNLMLGLKECNRQEVTSNLTPRKCKLRMLMEEIDLWRIFEGKAAVPTNPR